jgi:hypothetical protein
LRDRIIRTIDSVNKRLLRRGAVVEPETFGQKNSIEEQRILGFNTCMTTLLERAIDRVSVLPARKQNALAHLLLAEIDADARWDKSFESSQKELAELAEKALAERRKGKTRAMDLSHDF